MIYKLLDKLKLSKKANKDENEDFLNKAIDINRNDVFALVPYSNISHNMSNLALENKIMPFPNFETVNFSHNFDWTYKHHKNEVSYQLYLQSLRIVSACVTTFEQTNDKRYLHKGFEITESWMSFVDQGKSTEMTWYDHPTANRVQVLIQLIYHLKDNNIEYNENKYFDMLIKHSEFLMSDENYRKNNHGIMMDKSLLVLGYVTSVSYTHLTLPTTPYV